jgi:hypothetical protein
VKALLLFLAIVAGSSAVAGCSKGKEPEAKREPERQRRVEAPPRGVRALPPHAIRSDGVGPYKLGATVRQLLDQLPSGPRITQFALPNVIQRDIVRAEDGAILIGAEPQGKATFVSVVRSDIARTEAGVHVGSSREELVRALGAPLEDPERALDPRVIIPSKMRNARVLLDGDDRIAGFVITDEPERAKPAPGEARELTAEKRGDELVVLPKDSDKPIARQPLPGLVFAAPLRNPKDGLDEYVAIIRTEDSQAKAWYLAAFRLHEGKLQQVLKTTLLYSLSAADARWIGADIGDIELYLELTSRADSIDVGGLLTTRNVDKARNDDKIHDIVVITTTPVPRTRPRPAHEPSDAGTSDAQ